MVPDSACRGAAIDSAARGRLQHSAIVGRRKEISAGRKFPRAERKELWRSGLVPGGNALRLLRKHIQGRNGNVFRI